LRALGESIKLTPSPCGYQELPAEDDFSQSERGIYSLIVKKCEDSFEYLAPSGDDRKSVGVSISTKLFEFRNDLTAPHILRREERKGMSGKKKLME
jgi:hypothetical protein